MYSQRSSALMFFLIVSAFAGYTYFSDKTDAERRANQPQLEITAAGGSPEAEKITGENLIEIETDLHSLGVSLNGGDILRIDLKDQKQEIDSDENFHLLKFGDDFKYYATSDLVITENGERYLLHPKFTAPAASFAMEPDPGVNCAKLSEADESKLARLEVPLTYTDKNGTVFVKTFVFTQCRHTVDVTYSVENIGSDMTLSLESKLIQSVEVPESESRLMMASAYRGTAYSSGDTKYSKISLDDIAKQDASDTVETSRGGWISMIQHYFVAAWIGIGNHENVIFTQPADDHKTAVIGIRSTPVTAAKDSKAKLQNILWAGPKNQDEMAMASDHLDLTVDYGWLAVISEVLFKLLKLIHGIVHNWGVAIIVLTLIVRGLMYPLTKKQYVSMAKMKQLAPRLNQLKEKYQNDKQKLSEETIKLYAAEKVNPLGGCLPMFIQMPIFIALYWTLMESTELRHSPFILWIHDLSVLDPYYVLPLMMGLTMFITQRASMATVTDPTQKTIMTVMTVVFTFMFCTFPAGLTLYWVVSNIVTIVQQTIIYRHLEKQGLRTRAKPGKA